MNIKKILFPTDLTECGLMPVDYVVYLSKKYRTPVQILYVDQMLQLLYSMGPYAETNFGMLSENFKTASDKRIDDLITNSFTKSVSVEKLYRSGTPHREIVDAAAAEHSDLIIMGTHGHSGFTSMLGSNADRVARMAPCPVMVVGKRKTFDGFNQIVFPVDFSLRCRETLSENIELVRELGSELSLIHVVEAKQTLRDEELSEKFDKFLNKIDTSGTIYKKKIFRAHSVRSGIIDYAVKNEADLIMMGTHGYTGLKKIVMGGVTADVLNHSPIPVLVLREAPVKDLKTENDKEMALIDR